MALELGINSVDLAGLAAGTRYKMPGFRDFVSQNQKTPLGFNETTLFHVLNLADTSHYRSCEHRPVVIEEQHFLSYLNTI